MKAFVKALALLAVVGIVAMPASAATLRNAGSQVPAVFHGNVLTPPSELNGSGMLYAPSEADDPAYRAGIAASMICGSTVDYFDARYGTPTTSAMSAYHAVHTWANYAYLDPTGFGNNLAAYVDMGGCNTVVLGAFCTYCSGNCLRGAIMACPYCPVTSPSLSNHFSAAGWSGDYATCPDEVGATVGWQAFYRDYLAIQSCGSLCGTFTDGEIAVAVNTPGTVHYVNGSGGSPILWDANIEKVVANAACDCGPVPTLETTWGHVKDLYR